MQSAGFAAVAILAGDEWDSSMAVEGHQAKDGEDMQAYMNAISPGYFQTLKTPITDGRDFIDTAASGDLFSDTHSGVAIVNRRFAEHFFPGKSAVGKRLGWGGGPNSKLTLEIIGVVADSLYEGPREGVRRQVFLPKSGKDDAAFYVRTTTPSTSAFSMVRNEVRAMDPSIPLFGVKTVEELGIRLALGAQPGSVTSSSIRVGAARAAKAETTGGPR